MKPNETQPELVWYNGRWLLKSVVDRATAQWEAEKAEAKRQMLADAEERRAEVRRAKAQEQARKGEVPGGPANLPSQAQAPEPAKPVLSDPPSRCYGVASPIKAEAEKLRVEANPGNAGILAGETVYGGSGEVPSALPTGPGMPALPGSDLPSSSTPDPRPSPCLPISDTIKAEATSVAEKRGEAILSGQIKPKAEMAEQASGEATPGNAGTPAGRGGRWDSRGSEGGRAESVNGGTSFGCEATHQPNFMNENKTPPEMVWIRGHWLLKSAVDRIYARREEAKRAALAARRARRQAPRAKCQEPQPRGANRAERDSLCGAQPEGVHAEACSKQTAAGSPQGSSRGESRVERDRLPEGARRVRAAASINQSILSDPIKDEAENVAEHATNPQPSGARQTAVGSPQGSSGGENQSAIPNPQFRSRKGKIAGLPEEIRQALNERLENGEEGKALLDWLNGLPEVKSYLAAEFEGAPILEQNLSAWRKGGYADWLEHNAVVEVGLRLRENVTEWKEEAGDLDLPEALGYWLTGQYALATRNMGDLQGHEKWAQLWRIGLGVMRLRQVQQQGEKLKLAEARFAWKQEREAKRAEERAIVLALRKEEKAKRPQRREPTEEETEEAAQECREIFKPETEEDRAYYYKLRRDAEVADALARGEEPPPEEQPEEPSPTHVTKGKYF